MPRYRKKTRHAATSWGYVYVIKSSNGLYKIGLSKEPERRIKQLRKDYPNQELSIVRVIETDNMLATEYQLHCIYEKQKVCGEWFDLEPKDFKWIDRIERNIQAYIDTLR